MAAYVIVDVEIDDSEAYEEYKEEAAPSVKEFGGRYLVRGGEWEALEGEWRPNRLVVLEFDSLEDAKRWYESDVYRQARDKREGGAKVSMVVVRGAS